MKRKGMLSLSVRAYTHSLGRWVAWTAVLVVASAILAGCVTHHDITRDPNVETSELVGHRYRTTQDMTLLRDHGSAIYRLHVDRFPDKKPLPRYDRIGIIPAGTPLRVVRVVRIHELGEFLSTVSWRCTLARIQTGEHEGKEVGVAGNLMMSRYDATIGSEYLTPCECGGQ